ncbi:cellulase family glycosylhydrolase [Mycobacterium sp. NPDC003323]
MHVAEIEEVPSTIGIADSELYLQGSLEEINERLDLMQSLGVTNVRILVPWAGVQPLHPDTPFGLGAPRWDQLDMVVNAAAERGMGILGVLNSTPVWATSSTPVSGQPADFNRFADFARSVALRYGDKISAYEVWNEPNSAQFWNPLDPEDYTEMLKVTYTALKQASADIGSDITVVGGVVGAGLTWGDATMNPVDFVRRMYDAGADGYFDALSFHPYNYDSKFSVGDSLPWREGMPLYQVNRIRELMDSYQDVGEEQVKIWITEYGVPTNRVSEATQAAFIRDLIEFWQTAEGAGPIFIYTTQDRLNPAGNDDEAHLGIFRPDGTMKPAAEVIRELIEELADPTNPGPGPDPDPGPDPVYPSNPIAALVQALQQAVTSVLSLVPNLLNAVGVAITNIINGIFGGGAQPTTARTVRTAMAGDEDVAEVDAASAVTDSTDEEAATEVRGARSAADDDMAPDAAATADDLGVSTEVTDTEDAAEDEAAETAETATEVTTEPTVEATTEATPESATEPTTDAAEPSNDKTADTVDSADPKTSDDDEAAGNSQKEEDSTEPSDEAESADAADESQTESRETDAPEKKSREEQDSDTARDPQDEAGADGQSEQQSASSSRTPAGAAAGGGQ